MLIKIENIIVPEGRRPVDQAKVAEIAESIKVLGLLAPIGVHRNGDAPPVLVWGQHRLAACASLGMETIDAVAVDGLSWDRGFRDDAERDDFEKLAEISENLHRYELKTVHRDELLAKWVSLLEKHGTELGKRSRVPVPRKPGPKPSAAIAAVASASGMGQKTVKEAVRASKVSQDVKDAADRAGLSQKHRKKIARLATETEQLDAVARIVRSATASKQLDAVAKEAADHAESRVADVYGDTMRSVRSVIEAAISAYDGCDDASDQRARLFDGLYALLENLDRPARKPDAAA
jgi:ParB-like chromosome segregation protein Spo0J